MSSPASNREKVVFELLIYSFCAVLLYLSLLNITSYLSPKKVLGASIKTEFSETDFWDDFLSKNPNYIPGWIEIGRNDKVRNIDPNYPVK